VIFFGSSVANLGDLDGDGVIDLAVGADQDENGEASEGALYILFMHTNGSVNTSVKISDGLEGFNPSALNASDFFGSSVANLGDLDGDGIIDLAVGARFDENSEAGEGAVYILSLKEILIPTVNFVSPTPANNSVLSQTNISVNITSVDTNLDTIFIKLFNSTSDQINSTSCTTSPCSFNFTSLSDGFYYTNATANDTSGNENSTGTRNITLDTTSSTINFTNPTPGNGTSQNQSNVEINVSIVEENLDEVKFNWNGTNFTILNDSLILIMNFDNISALGENDTVVVDVSGYNNNGTVSGGNVTTANGKYERAMQFDGVDDIVTISSTNSINSDTDYTFEGWFKLNDAFDSSTSSSQIIMEKYLSNDQNVLLTLTGTDLLTSEVSDGSLFIKIENSGGTFKWSRTTSWSADTWYHFAIAWNETENNNTKIYVNGVDDTDNDQLEFADVTMNYVSDIKIGGEDADSSQLSGQRYFNGTIDEFRIWNRSLSAAEINQSYFTNLRKYDTNKWELYTNQTKNPKSRLKLLLPETVTGLMVLVVFRKSYNVGLES